jgi:hypothetical protein
MLLTFELIIYKNTLTKIKIVDGWIRELVVIVHLNRKRKLFPGFKIVVPIADLHHAVRKNR